MNRNLGKQFHGTSAELAPGQEILPASELEKAGVEHRRAFSPSRSFDHVFTTSDIREARHFGRNVYVVEPHNVAGQDPEYLHQGGHAWQSERATVVRRVSDEALQRLGQMQDRRAASYRLHDDGYQRRRQEDAARSTRLNRSRYQLEPDRHAHYSLWDDKRPRMKP